MSSSEDRGVNADQLIQRLREARSNGDSLHEVIETRGETGDPTKPAVARQISGQLAIGHDGEEGRVIAADPDSVADLEAWR